MASGLRGPLGGWERVVSRTGDVVRLDVTPRGLAVVVATPEGNELARAPLPYPVAGYGGHELVLSAQERYLALFLYSGQSEVGYELFGFRPELVHLGGFAYVFGEGLG
ncbi:MAG TPA: hypothetical protein VFX50_17025, partial [Gemmatimonadales bacterium]|nr:hypothetical protein [Gemmatimonadales bacterium]